MDTDISASDLEPSSEKIRLYAVKFITISEIYTPRSQACVADMNLQYLS